MLNKRFFLVVLSQNNQTTNSGFYEKGTENTLLW